MSDASAIATSKLANAQAISAPVLRERQIAGLMTGALVLVLLIIIAMPLWALLSKSVENGNGEFVGFRNFITYATVPRQHQWHRFEVVI